VDAGLVGGIVGATIGVLGGLVGTYFSIRNTAGPRERRFMIRVAIVAWIAVSAFVAGLLLLPKPYNLLLWIPYGIALPSGILWCNRRQRLIRGEEGIGAAMDTRPP
jgi:hypothetical protein